MGKNSGLGVVATDLPVDLLGERKMSWRWRKIFRWGPGSISISKGGVGWSIGFGLLRYGINPYGRRYISIGVPGTGLYFWKYLDRPFSKSESPRETEGSKPVLHKQENPADAPSAEEVHRENLEILKEIKKE